jgi:hypothetical protein
MGDRVVLDLVEVDEELRGGGAERAELLAEEDVEHLAAAMEPGSTAGVLIWENLWAAPFRIRGAAFGRPTDRQWTDPNPSNHRLDRGRRARCDLGE